MDEDDTWAEGIGDSLRKAIHEDGFLCEDEIKTNEDGSTWVKIDFFDSIMKWLKELKLI